MIMVMVLCTTNLLLLKHYFAKYLCTKCTSTSKYEMYYWVFHKLELMNVPNS